MEKEYEVKFRIITDEFEDSAELFESFGSLFPEWKILKVKEIKK